MQFNLSGRVSTMYCKSVYCWSIDYIAKTRAEPLRRSRVRLTMKRIFKHFFLCAIGLMLFLNYYLFVIG